MEHKTISQCQLQLLLQEELLDRYIRVLEIRRRLNLWRDRKILAIRIGHRKVHIPFWLIVLQRRNALYRLEVKAPPKIYPIVDAMSNIGLELRITTYPRQRIGKITIFTR